MIGTLSLDILAAIFSLSVGADGASISDLSAVCRAWRECAKYMLRSWAMVRLDISAGPLAVSRAARQLELWDRTRASPEAAPLHISIFRSAPGDLYETQGLCDLVFLAFTCRGYSQHWTTLSFASTAVEASLFLQECAQNATPLLQNISLSLSRSKLSRVVPLAFAAERPITAHFSIANHHLALAPAISASIAHLSLTVDVEYRTADLHSLLSSCSNLITLELNSSGIGQHHANLHQIPQILHLPSLTTLSIVGMKEVDGLDSFAVSSLTSLRIEEFAWSSVSVPSLIRLLSRSNLLENIEVVGRGGDAAASEAPIELPNVTHFRIAGRGFWALAGTIRLSGTRDLHLIFTETYGQSVNACLSNAPCTTTLHVTKLLYDHRHRILPLRHARLSILRASSDCLAWLQTCKFPSLQSLQLWSSNPRYPPRIGTHLNSLANHSTAIRTLSLEGMNVIGDEFSQGALKMPHLESLELLRCSNVHHVIDQMIHPVFLPRLARLRIHNCKGIFPSTVIDRLQTRRAAWTGADPSALVCSINFPTSTPTQAETLALQSLSVKIEGS
ncbi:hypothetical protein BOTBODRAFT_174976 [Botryobasidium botryosum FD-172 SS1]|uniref:F-box domain-containing protein n=1 Tax=Botryobasidium botryosum (strain FD-172 SS1) TaxID=930990 RepID=A0A067MEI6_BOTB1|nr:hypothetical protein BOTBODRAFT_174976 [Botryobasidium botryosum FD-172 SS1]